MSNSSTATIVGVAANKNFNNKYALQNDYSLNEGRHILADIVITFYMSFCFLDQLSLIGIHTWGQENNISSSAATRKTKIVFEDSQRLVLLDNENLFSKGRIKKEMSDIEQKRGRGLSRDQ